MPGLWWATPLVVGQGGQGNSQDRCPDCSQQACPDSSPQLAWTQSSHSLYYFDVESPRPSLTRGTLEDPRQPESPFYLGPSLRIGAEGLSRGIAGGRWGFGVLLALSLLLYAHPFFSVSIKWPHFHH